MIRSEMLERMPASEFNEWMILEKIEPFGDRRADVLAGMICSIIANVNRGPKARPMPVDKFIPKWEEQPRQQTSSDMLRFIQLAQSVQAGIVVQQQKYD